VVFGRVCRHIVHMLTSKEMSHLPEHDGIYCNAACFLSQLS
jgi:hypothetical protein